MKRMNRKIRNLIFVILGVLFGFIIANWNINEDSHEKNDFYDAINENTISEKQLDSDESYWGVFMTDTQDKIDEKIETEINEILQNSSKYSIDSDEYKIVQLYNSYINKENDLSVLDNYIKMIDNSQNINRFIENVVKINKELSMGLIIGTGIGKDLKDNSKIMIEVSPFIFDGVNGGDYYTNPLYSTYAGAFIKYDREILKLYGYSNEEAKEAVKSIYKLYVKIAENSKTIEDLAQIEHLYNVVSKDELKEIYSNINIMSFIKDYNKYDTIILPDIEQAKTLNNLLNNENLETWKEYAKLQILKNYAAYADNRYLELMDKMEAELKGTEITTDTIEDKANDLITESFDTTLSKKYVEKYVNDNDIKVFKDIISDIIEEYEVRINNNNWLSNETKEKAILKLKNMKINVGYPDKWEEYSQNYNLSNSLLENIIDINRINIQFQKEVIENHEEYWITSPLTVNAFYNPQDNSINFPAVLLEASFYNKDNTYFQNLGALGAIIGHEISHSFDNNGSLFDEKGNIEKWWTDKDYKEFEKKQETMINYYNQFKINGTHVNGKLTVSENIADLGGVSVILQVAKRKGATHEDLKELFESYAKLWASKATDEYTMIQMMTDTHSPDKVRVNAVLSSIDEFYEVYNITKKDGMYIEKEERVKVW